MEKFEVHILGCGSALPTLRHHPASQVVNIHEKLIMIDCGEGAQLQMRRARLPFSRLNHIFISHLHGDHCFGLPGLISTFSLLGRTAPLFIHAPKELELLLRPQLDFHCSGATFKVEFQPFCTSTPAVIYEDRTMEISTLPLRHRLPCCGFIIREKPSLPHIRRDMIDFYGIPNYEIARIKLGGDWTREDGTIVPHERLVKPAQPPRSYAYISDTVFMPENASQLQQIDLLYHEATFEEAESKRAAETRHSTARQAGEMARMSGAKKLISGHLSSRYCNGNGWLDEARDIFPNTEVAQEGKRFAIGEKYP